MSDSALPRDLHYVDDTQPGIRRKTLRGEQGEVTIQFGSLDELDGLIDKLRRAGGGEAA